PLLSLLLCLAESAHHPVFLPFPTRRSSDLRLTSCGVSLPGCIAGTYCTEALVRDIQLPSSSDKLGLLEKKSPKEAAYPLGDRSCSAVLSDSANWSIVSWNCSRE